MLTTRSRTRRRRPAGSRDTESMKSPKPLRLPRLQAEQRRESSFVVDRWRSLLIPKIVRSCKIGVHRWSGQDHEASHRFAATAKRVSYAARNEHESFRTNGELHLVNLHEHFPVEHEVRLGAVGVTRRGRATTVGWQGAFHQGEIATVLLGDGLKEHFAAPFLIDTFTFAPPQYRPR